ncbi:hypothetical protein GCM10011297_08130 [Bacterioplanes sanyensis]|nr:hypothetical protein GCM10011297_08130 [Bacterioplanes sanyensis]
MLGMLMIMAQRRIMAHVPAMTFAVMAMLITVMSAMMVIMGLSVKTQRRGGRSQQQNAHCVFLYK